MPCAVAGTANKHKPIIRIKHSLFDSANIVFHSVFVLKKVTFQKLHSTKGNCIHIFPNQSKIYLNFDVNLCASIR